jgi:hypothetical protein
MGKPITSFNSPGAGQVISQKDLADNFPVEIM